MPVVFPTPFWSAADRRACLWQGDVRAVLRKLPAASVQCVVTSPPYWGLRDYGVQGQLGSEPSPDCGTSGQTGCGCFVCNMVAVFREVRRVLRNDGTLWLNLGDTYASQGGDSGRGPNSSISEAAKEGQLGSRGANRAGLLPSGNLCGVPWRVALALQADGWVLRQEIIWHKPSPMPESVRNRCTKAHEHVFLLTKGQRYFYDADAIRDKEGRFYFKGVRGYREGVLDNSAKLNEVRGDGANYNGANKRSVWSVENEQMVLGWLMANYPDVAAAWHEDAKNKPDVWKVASAGYPGAHFATFPEKLIEPMILAGTSAHGACAKCGSPWQRVTERCGSARVERVSKTDLSFRPQGNPSQQHRPNGKELAEFKQRHPEKDLGWAPTCDCGYDQVKPCVVLDPFVGSGTTPHVALKLGRAGWGIDLSEQYLSMHAVPRLEGFFVGRGMAGAVGKGPVKVF